MNQNEKCSEFISLFIDDNLRRGIKGVRPQIYPSFRLLISSNFPQKTDLEVEAILDKTITIFRFISEKDVFERYYKGHLAKRLLHSRSVSDDAEHNMLTKLKIESGVQFTQKMEGMFNDIKISADTTKAYLDHVSKTTVWLPPSTPSSEDSAYFCTSYFLGSGHRAQCYCHDIECMAYYKHSLCMHSVSSNGQSH